MFHLNTAAKEWSLKAKTLSDTNRWITALQVGCPGAAPDWLLSRTGCSRWPICQDAIESCSPLTTKFMKLVAAYSEADPFTMEEVTMDHPVRQR